MATYNAKNNEVSKKWVVVDLDGAVLGRAATQVADILRGKNKAQYTPNTDTGDFVVAINASKLVITGKKSEQKVYYRHTGYPGGIKEVKAQKLLGTHPDRIFSTAVKGMLPKNILSRHLIKKLKIYSGAEHPHGAQLPAAIKL